MVSSCAHLCQRCTRLFPFRITWQSVTHVQLCTAAIKASAKLPYESSLITENNTTARTRQRWKQQMCYYSDLTNKHLTPEATENKDKELLRSEIVKYESPVTQIGDAESRITLDLDAADEPSALEEFSDEEAVGVSVSPPVPPASFSLRVYVNKSETLNKLVQLGVNLWKLEQRPNVGSMLLKLDFQTDVAPRLLFLKEMGVEDSRLGYIVTHNPFILTESLENLQARVVYLRSKKFSAESVASMVSRAPYLLNFSVKRLDNRLSFFQQQLSLSAANTRNVVARLPRLLCGSLEPIKENLKVCKIELGFKENEIQHIVVAVPKVLTANKRKITQTFDFLHNIMKVPHHLIAKFPQVLNSKYLRLKERHQFLEYLGKAQYDPAQPNYISLDRLVSLPDDTFCTELASATLNDFYLFQKTL